MKVKTRIYLTLAIGCVIAIWAAIGRQIAAEAVYPIENGAGWFSRHITHPLKEALVRPRLAAENRRLKDEIASLKMQLADHGLLAAENAKLRNALDFNRRNPGEWIAAPVLSRGGVLGVGDVMRLGKGTRSGICKGAAVASEKGLVGRVSTVSPDTAEVRLITDPEIKVACEIETKEPDQPAAFGILSGRRLVHLKRDLILQTRAKIVTSGHGGVYPRGLTVGFLSHGTHEDETQLEREGEVEPAVDFPSLEIVFIHREE